MAPFKTLLKVRELLARRAVTRAVNEAGNAVMVIELDQQTFPLTLGWKISDTTNRLVEFLLGDASFASPNCAPQERSETAGINQREGLAVETIRSNSNQMCRIKALLSSAN